MNKSPDATQRTIELGEAYEILRDPAARKEYDRFLAAQQQETRSSQKGYTAYSDFNRYREAAQKTAKHYSESTLEDVLNIIAKFAIEATRTVLYGERDKPSVDLGDYIKMGFYGVIISICIIVAFTGIGTIPASAIIYFTIRSASKNGAFIGLVPFITAALLADLIVIVVLFFIIMSIIPV